MTYGKTEVVQSMARKAGITQEQAKKSLDAFLETLLDCAKSGEDVKVPGYFNIERVMRAARTGRNPRTGEALTIPAKEVLRISVGSTLKDAVEKE